MRELLVVLNTRAQSLLKRASTWDWGEVAKNMASVIIFGGFGIGMFFVARSSTMFLLDQAHIGLYLFHRLLSMLLFVFFVTVNLGNMIVSFSTLYRSPEVSFLMTLPISHAKIFLIKFVDNFFYSSSTLAILGFALLLGYGSYFGFPWFYYFFAIFFLFLPFMLIAGILAITSLMLLIRIGVQIGFKWLIALLVLGYLCSMYFYFTVTNPMQLVEDVMKHYPDVNEYFGYLDPPLVQYLPNHWVSEFMYWTIFKEWAKAFPYFSLLFLTMVALIILAALGARRFYYESWLAVMDVQASRVKPEGERGGRITFERFAWLTPQTSVVVKREILLFLREPSQWLHLVLMLLLLMMFLVSVGSLELKLAQPFLQSVAFLIVVLFDGFLVASIALRFVFPSMSLEGDTFWSVRTSPMSLKRLYWLKFWLAAVPVLVAGECVTLSSVYLLQRNLFMAGMAGVCMFFMSLSLVALNFGAGSYFATYKEKNPIRVASSQGASLTFLGSILYLAVVVAVLMVPLVRYYSVLIQTGRSYTEWAIVPVAIIAVVSGLVFALASTAGMKAAHSDF